MPDFRIAGRRIGPGHPVYVIAELSANHHGELARARDLVVAAAQAGADAVKLQTYTADTITLRCDNEHFRIADGPWQGRLLWDLYEEAFTPWEWHEELADLARRHGLHCLSSPFDETAVDFLERMDVPAYKVASFELVDVPLLEKIGATGKPVILSTGMAGLEEIEEAVAAVRGAGAGALAILHTNSGYPADPAEVHLTCIRRLAETFDVVSGLSDHTLGTAVAVAAVGADACIVEKHLTVSRAEPGPDAAFSLEPAEFRTLVEGIRTAEKAMGSAVFGPTPRERVSLPFRRSLFVVRDIAEGEPLTRDNVRSIRPAAGLHPRHLPEVLGSAAARDLTRGTPLSWDMVGGSTWDEVSIRPATPEDCRCVFDWANDPLTRRMSFSTDAIAWTDHQRWYEGRLRDPSCLFYIAVLGDGERLGQIRLDLDGPTAVISVSVAPAHRGRGLAARVVRLAVDAASREQGVEGVDAFIVHGNTASIRTFAAAGFDGPTESGFRGVPALRMTWHRGEQAG